MSVRKIHIVTGAIVFMAALAGCSGPLVKDSYSFDANKSTLNTDGTEYEEQTVESTHQSKKLDVAGQNTTINMTVWTSHYSKTSTKAGYERPISQVVLLSAPNAKIVGQSVNPLAHLSNKQLATRLAQQSDGQIRDISEVESSTVSILGTEENSTKFSGTLQTQNQKVPAYIHLTKTTHEGDVVVALQIYPQEFEDRVNFKDAMARVEH